MASPLSFFIIALTLFCGFIWVLDNILFFKQRRKKALVDSSGDNTDLDSKQEQEAKIKFKSRVLNLSRKMFPALAIILIIRSFFYESYKIPSESMMPTLMSGDYILVEKFSYGIKEPLWMNKLVEVSKPKRGDVAVFKSPENIRVDFIKRVIGEPGDKIVYKDKKIYLNHDCDSSKCFKNQLDKVTFSSSFVYNEDSFTSIFKEEINKVKYQTRMTSDKEDDSNDYYQQTKVKTADNEWIVPEGSYFVMGDNRDNSRDSRYFGFVKEEYFVGKAVVRWISFDFESKDDWIPSKVRFNRIGFIN